MYRYIGNKTKLLPFITERIKDLIGEEGTVVDIMAGTGLVSRALREEGYNVVASDMMTYSYHHLVVNLLLRESPRFLALEELLDNGETPYDSIIRYLNSLEGIEGFFFKEFSPGGCPKVGCSPRGYFTSDNAMKIDAIREKINYWIEHKRITDHEESLLKHTLILATNRVANISGTYGYFLSEFKKNSLESIKLRTDIFLESQNINHQVMQGFAEDVSKEITADVCYIDPPYMKRQYAANYHILETIARGDYPDAVGKSGLRDWWDQHSKLCTKTKGLNSFKEIISNMDCDIFLISYSEDGLFTLDQLIETFSEFGTVTYEHIDYNRFRSNKSSLSKTLKEYLITIHKNKV